MFSIKNLFKRSKINEEVDQAKYSKLSALFLKDPKKAIEKSEKYLIKSTKFNYPQYIEKVKSTQKSNACIASWDTNMLCGQCFDCQLQKSTCFCIKCYIEGHHYQHNSIVCYYPSGCCDCGNPFFIKSDKFCPHHPGPDPNPDVTQMTKEDRQKFITIFKAAFYAIITTDSPSICHSCLQYMSEFIQLGDGFRRCAAYAISSLSKKELYDSIPRMTEDMVSELIEFFGKIMSDLSFLDKMTYYYYINSHNLGRILIELIKKKQTNVNAYLAIVKYNSFIYHFFNEHKCDFIQNNPKFNWADYFVDYFEQIIETILASDITYSICFDSLTLSNFFNIPPFLAGVLKSPDQHEKLQEYIDKFSKYLIKCEGLFGFTIRLTPQNYSEDGYLLYNMIDGAADIVQQFSKVNKTAHPSNLHYSIDVLVKSLNDYFELKKPEPASILNSQLKTEIESFIPLHLLFSYVVTNFSDPKSEIEKACLKQQIDFEDFCMKASIFPLRLLASVYHQGKFLHSSSSIRLHMKHIIEKPKVLFNPCFRLVQLLLGICGNKEKFMENALITFGLFDDLKSFMETMDSSDVGRQIFLSQYSYLQTGIFVLSLMTDRSIIALDEIVFNRLQVIELLLRKSSSAAEIEKCIGERLNDPIVADSLLDYIERFSTKNGSRFRVKNKGDFTPFFPPISSDNRINFLLKSSDKNLVPLLDYADLPNNLSFKEVFRMPSFIVITFALLSAKDADVPTTQVGLSLFVSMVRNGEAFPPESFDEPNPIAIKGPTLHEVLNAFEKVGDKLNEVNILTIPIQIGEEQPVSLLQLVQAKKELGTSALERANLPSNLYRKEDDENQARIKACKAKAQLLKQRLMKDFQNRRKRFGLSEENVLPKEEDSDEKWSEAIQESDDENNEEFNKYDGFDNAEILCSICLTESDDIFGFPCLSLPSNLSFIAEAKLNGAAVDGLNYDLMPDSFIMSICGHHMHYKCFERHFKDALGDALMEAMMNNVKVDNIEQISYYRCPIDCRIRNCFLPLFPDMANASEKFSMKLPSIMNEPITDFLKSAFFEKASTNLNVPIQAFTSMITLLEIRHRNRPDCLDSPDVPALLHNLLLTIYHGIHASLLNQELKNNTSDPLFELVFRTVCSNSPFEEFASIVQKIASGLEKVKLYQFLRRAAIIEEFALKDRSKNTEFVDWDDVLSFGCLIERFTVHAQMEEIVLPILDSIKLPEKFISLYQPPFNIDIFDSSAIRAIDLLTGNIVCIPPNEKNYSEKEYKIDSNYDLITNYIKKAYKGGIGLFMFLTGPNSTSFVFYSSLLNKFWIKDSFYTDQFGDSDPGFNRGIITTLSKDKLDCALDFLLSGELP